MKNSFSAAVFLTLTFAVHHCYADNLQQVALAAMHYDSELQSSLQTSEADKQKYWQGLSGMLPTLSLEGSWNHQEQPEKKYQTGVTSHNYDFRLKQPLFDLSKYAGWRKGVAIANTAQAQARLAEEKLLNAIANAYFNVLHQQEVLNAAQAATHNFRGQMKKIELGLQNGQNTRTELDEAQANYALAQAKQIEASNQLLLAGEALRKLSGISPDRLEPVNFQCLKSSPYPSLDEAIHASQRNNTSIRVASFQHDQAKADVLAADSAHLPVVSLYASYGKAWSRNSNDDNILYDAIFGNQSKSDNLQYGVNVSVPIFAGGSQLSQSFEAAYRREAARYSTIEATRKAVQDTRSAWLSLHNGQALLDAEMNAVAAAKKKMTSVEYGREMGFRTVNDELDAQQKYFTALKEQADARFQYLTSLVNLAQSTGSLSLDMMKYFQCS